MSDQDGQSISQMFNCDSQESQKDIYSIPTENRFASMGGAQGVGYDDE